jgi:hypothetical protein
MGGRLMRNEQEIIEQHCYYREKLEETNLKLHEAIRREDLKEIEIFKSNQVMYAERLMTLSWVLETVDQSGLTHPFIDAVSTSCLEA